MDLEEHYGNVRNDTKPAPMGGSAKPTGARRTTLVVEQAGGRASTGTQRILDIQAELIHQRVPLVIGSAEDVALYEKFLRDGSPS